MNLAQMLCLVNKTTPVIISMNGDMLVDVTPLDKLPVMQVLNLLTMPVDFISISRHGAIIINVKGVA